MLANLLVYAFTDPLPDGKKSGSLKQYDELSRANARRLNQAKHIEIHQKRLLSQKALEAKAHSDEGITYHYWKIVNDWVQYHWPDRRL
ncbi:hypothetical protein [Endozoicomonas sp.]|uniref:hypothetical protein n=1 Tax=Endozoicomonas sp. TaxID=1892382 RepID=UPI003D9BA1A5